MKNTLFLASALCCLSAATGKTQISNILPKIPPEYTAASYQLQGPVKSLQFKINGKLMYGYIFDAEQRLTEHTIYGDNAEQHSVFLYEYGANGKVSKKTTLVRTDSKLNDVEIFTYDDQDRLKEIKGKNGKRVYEYKSNGLVESDNVYVKNKLSRFYTCEYDAQGRLLRLNDYNCNKRGNCDPSPFSPSYGYDEQGRPNLEVRQQGQPEELRSEYSYDELGRRSEDVFASKEIGRYQIRYSYNAEGRVQKTVLWHNEAIKSTSVFEYDAKGNWIKCTSESTNPEQISITEQIIEYY